MPSFAKERWLKYGNDEQFADAMMRCQNAAGTCGQEGGCLLGECFRKQPRLCGTCNRPWNGVRGPDAL